MAWQELGPYRDSMIWVWEVGVGRRVIAVTPLRIPGSPTPVPLPPEEMVLPQAFDAEAKAIEATKRFLDCEDQRRSQQSTP